MQTSVKCIFASLALRIDLLVVPFGRPELVGCITASEDSDAVKSSDPPGSASGNTTGRVGKVREEHVDDDELPAGDEGSTFVPAFSSGGGRGGVWSLSWFTLLVLLSVRVDSNSVSTIRRDRDDMRVGGKVAPLLRFFR